MIKIIIINHTFQKKEFYKRWKILAEKHDDLDVTLLAPSEWKWGAEKNLTYGHVECTEGSIVEEKNFRVHLIDTKMNRLGEWTSDRLEKEIVDGKPDFVYFIGGFTASPLMQIYKIRKAYKLTDMKVLSFSMRGHEPTLSMENLEPGLKNRLSRMMKYVVLGPRLKCSNKECDAVFCHYPDAFNAFVKDGYNGPIYIQTQVGVDTDVFYPNEKSRKKIRKKYEAGDAYLFGSASRFHYSKGLSRILYGLPDEGNWKYLMMGWGRPDEVDELKRVIDERHLNDKVILTGYIDNWTDMAEHWNALDCAIHIPLTTPKWEETFSLALTQAMATALPVIGSNSGSVPYQIGEKGIIIAENNSVALSGQALRMMNNPAEGKKIGQAMYDRAVNCFGIYHLDELFYQTICDIMNGVYDKSKSDMAEFRS